jgi:hypothetical protein
MAERHIRPRATRLEVGKDITIWLPLCVLHTAARSRLPVEAEYRPRRARLRIAADPPSQHQRGVRALPDGRLPQAAGRENTDHIGV